MGGLSPVTAPILKWALWGLVIGGLFGAVLGATFAFAITAALSASALRTGMIVLKPDGKDKDYDE